MKKFLKTWSLVVAVTLLVLCLGSCEFNFNTGYKLTKELPGTASQYYFGTTAERAITQGYLQSDGTVFETRPSEPAASFSIKGRTLTVSVYKNKTLSTYKMIPCYKKNGSNDFSVVGYIWFSENSNGEYKIEVFGF